MKAVILAGGRGTRLAEETSVRPKPMVEIGGRPVLWHIMKIYAEHGLRDFIVCLGYRGDDIKDFFLNTLRRGSDLTVDLANGTVAHHRSATEPWRVTLVDTGAETETGGRLRRVAHHLEPDTPFCMTYGDGVADIDIGALTRFHKAHGKAATITAVRPPGRFGALALAGTTVSSFMEKPRGDGGYINGGFFVLSPAVIARIGGDAVKWEDEPLASLARDDQLRAFIHEGFWQPMDTLRDRQHLEQLWAGGRAPWKVWADDDAI
jgi:glucose-1-phosphate cytidylyltransferase